MKLQLAIPGIRRAAPLLLLLAPLLAPASSLSPSVSELRDQALSIWEEGGRLSRSGAYLPREFPGFISLVTSLPAEVAPARRAALAKVLGGYADEVRRHGAQVNPFGQLLLRERSSGLLVGERVTLRQDYRVGAPILPGGGLLIATHWTHEVSLTAGAGEGSQGRVSLEAPDGVRFSPGTELRGGMHGGYDRPERQLFFTLVEGSLQPGQLVTLTYTNLQLPNQATDTFTLPIYVRLQADGHLFSVRPPQLNIVGGAPVRVLARMPSVLRRNQPFPLKLTALDKFGNLSAGRVPGLEVMHGTRFFARLQPFQGEANLVPPVFTQTGEVRLQLRSGGGNPWGETNPARVSDDPGYQLVWADLQQRTSLSDAQGSLAAHLRLAGRDDLAILGVAEQDVWLNAAGWQTLMSFKPPAEPLLLPGLSFARPPRTGGGQLSLLLRPQPKLRLEEVGRQYHAGPGAWLRARPDSRFGDDWYHLAVPEPETNLRSLLAPVLSGVQLFGGADGSPWLAEQLEAHGHEVSVLGTAGRLAGLQLASGGVSAFWRETGESLTDALRQGRNYATSGARILLELRVNGRLLPARLPAAAERRFEGWVQAEQPIAGITLWKNGRVFRHLDYLHPEKPPAEPPVAPPSRTPPVVGFETGNLFGSTAPPATEPVQETASEGRLEFGWLARSLADDRDRELLLSLGSGSYGNPLGGGLSATATDDGLLLRLLANGRRLYTRLPLTGLDEDTILNLTLAGGRGSTLRIPLVEMRGRQLTRSVPLANGGRHSFTLQLHPDGVESPSSLPTSRRFQLLDRAAQHSEDLYVLEVRQLDDQLARTRGIRVGGHRID